MSIKSSIKLYDNIRNGVSIFEVSDEIEIHQAELADAVEIAKNLITEKFPEKDLVKFMSMVQKLIVSIMASKGESGILLAEMDGCLQGYTHTVVLSVIGALIEEEIL